jgi:hypothetical protein
MYDGISWAAECWDLLRCGPKVFLRACCPDTEKRRGSSAIADLELRGSLHLEIVPRVREVFCPAVTGGTTSFAKLQCAPKSRGSAADLKAEALLAKARLKRLRPIGTGMSYLCERTDRKLTIRRNRLLPFFRR